MILQNDKIDPDLLYRYFVKSEKYNKLLIKQYGLQLVCIKTVWGVFRMVPRTKEALDEILSTPR